MIINNWKQSLFYRNIFEMIVAVISPASAYKAKQKKKIKDREEHYYMYIKLFKSKCVDVVWFFINFKMLFVKY